MAAMSKCKTTPVLKGFYSKNTKCTAGRARDYYKPSKQTKDAWAYLHNNFLVVFACNIYAGFQMDLRSI